ncbi:MAG TPA: Asp-tRNA(Asn)/Glu-tRNA(Gln) amidotransferase subunit GatB [Limnochordia bacterium]|nr:Asp-tRNA(Asn)/Glu-tRNA(Gln) amidotransferase subunit GatB [Limnochordia bacterium]
MSKAPVLEQTYEVVIGLEIHAELRTESKIWCGCKTDFGAEPNSQVCPICLGLPGALPVLNQKALAYAIQAGLALGCEIARFSKFDRKNYYYPDLPKAYQISQYDLPICGRGALEIAFPGGARRIGITRVHLEEEAGKSVHAGDNILGADHSLIDYNRTGIPLIEIVTEPDLRSAEEARLFLEHLRSVLRYTGVSDCKMEEGSLRCDANVSLRPAGSDKLGVKTEVKNLNSFRSVQRAIEYEVRRQSEALAAGEPLRQETRHWHEPRGVTIAMRSKEEAHDYRYFPDPDLVPLEVDPAWVAELATGLPELPAAREARFVAEYGLPAYDAGILTAHKAVADFFETVAAATGDAKTASNWVMGEVLRLLGERPGEPDAIPIAPAVLVEVLQLSGAGKLSGAQAKAVLEEAWRTGAAPAAIVAAKGLEQITDDGAIAAIVDQVIAAHPGPVADYRGGKQAALGFLVGQVMKQSKGKANPKRAGELLRERLG